MKEKIIVRKARSGDEAEIANVHLNAWREAYQGILQQSFLDDLPLSYKRRLSWWTKALQENQSHIFVAESESGIVGFSGFGSSRDNEFKGYGELHAIYLLKKFHGRGIGFNLLKYGFNEFTKNGIKQAYCWVLAQNPTIRFYEETGAKFNGISKEVEIGGEKYSELAYVWKSLS